MSNGSRYSSYVGREGHSCVYEIERGHIRRFVEAIGESDPIYLDDEAARAAGHPRIPAPPTFATALRPPDPRDGLEIDWTKLLHGEQEFRYERPVYVGDRLTVRARIEDAYAKAGRSGEMDFLVLETRATDEQDQLVYTARSLVVIRR